MAFQPGQSGNPAGRPKRKAFSDALLMELAQSGDPERLRKVARALIAKALDGDMPAIKELADRLDGKVPQAIVGDADFDPVRLVVTPVDASL